MKVDFGPFVGCDIRQRDFADFNALAVRNNKSPHRKRVSGEMAFLESCKALGLNAMETRGLIEKISAQTGHSTKILALTGGPDEGLYLYAVGTGSSDTDVAFELRPKVKPKPEVPSVPINSTAENIVLYGPAALTIIGLVFWENSTPMFAAYRAAWVIGVAFIVIAYAVGRRADRDPVYKASDSKRISSEEETRHYVSGALWGIGFGAMFFAAYMEFTR